MLTPSLFKEVDTYREEVVAAKQTLDKLKAEGADGADIRNAVSASASLQSRALAISASA
jgi:hypothetical protein